VYSAVGGSTDDILPEIIIPPSSTSCIESIDISVKMECVANARSYAHLYSLQPLAPGVVIIYCLTV